jgi:hypothetical protein
MRVRGLYFLLLLGLCLPAGAQAQNRVFETSITGSADSRLTGVVVGEVDGDPENGKEIVVTRQSNDVAVLQLELENGFINLDPDTIPVGSFPTALLLDNFDDDGNPDLVVVNANSSDMVYLQGLQSRDYFESPADAITVGEAPHALAAYDLDVDGDLDVVVANAGSGTVPGSVSILRATAPGVFDLILQPDPEHPGQVLPGIPAQLATHDVAVGLIDGDDLPDILAINTSGATGVENSPGTATLFRGTGALQFADGESFPIGNGPESLVLDDLNDDGELDMVTADSLDDSVSVLLGNGDGSFGTRFSYKVGNFPIAVAVDDVDGDGILDAVSTNTRSHDLSVLRGDGTGQLKAPRTFVSEAEPTSLSLADMDGDDDVDIVAAHGGDEGAVAVLLNRGDGSYRAVEDILVSASPTSVVSADVDNDSLPDLVVATESGSIRIFRAIPGEGFGAPTTVETAGQPSSLIVRDLNGDAQGDLAFADRTGRIAVAFGRATGGFGPIQGVQAPTEPAGITAGDFNGDGLLDLAVTIIVSGQPGATAVALQRPDHTFGAPGSGATRVADRQFGVGETPIVLASDDFNADGRDDLVVVNQASSNIMLFRSRADGGFDNIETLASDEVGQGPLSIDLGDFNRDGKTDFVIGLAISPAGSPSVRIFNGDGDGTFTFTDSVQAGLVISSLVGRDFNYDGFADLMVINQTSNAVSLLTGNGTGRFRVCQTDIAVSRMPVTLAAADFDDDGRYDAATGNNDRSANNASVIHNCLGDPHCPIPTRTTLCAFTAGTIPLRGDGNDDGALSAADLVVVSRVVRDVKGTRVEEVGLEAFSGFTGAAPGVDANGDGRVDYQDRIAVARRIFRS